MYGFKLPNIDAHGMHKHNVEQMMVLWLMYTTFKWLAVQNS